MDWAYCEQSHVMLWSTCRMINIYPVLLSKLTNSSQNHKLFYPQNKKEAQALFAKSYARPSETMSKCWSLHYS